MKKYILGLASLSFAFWFSVAPQLPDYCVQSADKPGQFTKHFVTGTANGVIPYLVVNKDNNKLEASLGQKEACKVAAYKF
jgi:hypothetical protein